MTKIDGPPPVVVGVDAAGGGRDALDWALAEAAARSRPLWIVHACAPRIDPALLGAAPSGPALDTRDVLDDAARRARWLAPEVEAVTCLVAGGPVPAMLAQRAELIVIGARGPGRLRGALTGSVAVALCAHAHAPVVVVPPLGAVVPGPSPARVVVGVDGSELSGPAIGFALAAAAQRGVGVTALHAWSARLPDPGAVAVGGESVGTGATPAADRVFTGPLARWQQWFPAVEITTKLVEDDPAHALGTESAGAAMVVVGSRGRGRVSGAVFGSVSQAVMLNAHCPVAVIRPQAARTRTARAA